MSLDVKVPTVGESINEVTLSKWIKKDGDYVQRDEVICELESDKATFELNAEQAGVLKINAKEGDTLKIGDSVATIDTDAQAPSGGSSNASSSASSNNANGNAPANGDAKSPVAENAAPQDQPGEGDSLPKEKVESGPQPNVTIASSMPPQPAQPQGNQQQASQPAPQNQQEQPTSYATGTPSPAAAKIMAEQNINGVNGSGKAGRVTKADVMNAIKQGARPAGTQTQQAPTPAPTANANGSNGKTAQPLPANSFSRETGREKMSSLRKTISKRLVAAKNQTAMLTTFNEVDMKPVMDIRTKYKDAFQKKHGVSLGFMSFFTKAVCNALQEWPAVNAAIDGEEIIYHDYCDISIAVSTPKGLTTPVIRNAESMTMMEIEAKVGELAKKGRDNKLTLDEMSGGTFTISNGGVFGSLMSTPILNQPQSAILGMHKIEERPIARDGQVIIRPMMYLALSYDHRIIDGRESVSFLVRVKEQLENPEQLLVGADPVKLLLDV